MRTGEPSVEEQILELIPIKMSRFTKQREGEREKETEREAGSRQTRSCSLCVCEAGARRCGGERWGVPFTGS